MDPHAKHFLNQLRRTSGLITDAIKQVGAIQGQTELHWEEQLMEAEDFLRRALRRIENVEKEASE